MAQQNSRAQQQRRQLIIILLVIIIMAFGLFYFVLSGDKAEQKQAPQAPQGKVAVPTLKENFNMGQRISTNDFRISYFDPEDVPIDAIIQPKEFVGRFAVKPLLAGSYIHEDDITQPGANANFSGIVSPGKRLVVIDGNLFPGALDVLNVGDHIDLLAIGEPNRASATSSAQNDYMASLERAVGGTQPGNAGGVPPRFRKGQGGGGGAVGSASATLIAENAIVKKKPTTRKNKNFLVLEMEPQDAHVTTLMVSAGASMRFVFRPFNDTSKHLETEPIKVTTRLPKPVPDPDAVMFIMGNVRSNTVPVSERYNTNPRDYYDETDVGGTGTSDLFKDKQGKASIQNNANQNMNANLGYSANSSQSSDNNNLNMSQMK